MTTSHTARIQRRPITEGAAWPADVLPLLQRLYTARGVTDPAQAQPKLAQLHAPELMGGMQAAVDLLASAIAHNERILVVGDFDCDGATACAVGVRGLRLLGARDVVHAVPNRMLHGYGLSPSLVAELASLQPGLLVTVDHGIACHAGVAAAKALGWKVLVTDHHLPGEHLPPADALVDPNLQGDAFPSKALAGVGVIFYVLMALRRHLREQGAFASTPEPDLLTLLDLVAGGAGGGRGARGGHHPPPGGGGPRPRSARWPTWSRWMPTTAHWCRLACAACAPGRAVSACRH